MLKIINYNKNVLYYENKSLYERVKDFEYDEHIKSTVKGNLSTNYWDNYINPHTSASNFVSCSSSGKIIKSDSFFNYPPDYINAKLKHYYYKSFEEYCLKIKRGQADRNEKENIDIIYYKYKKLYDRSRNNSEKIKIMKKIFNISL